MIRLTFEQREEERRYKERKKAEARARLIRTKVTTGTKLAQVEAPVMGKRRVLTDREKAEVHREHEGGCWACGVVVPVSGAGVEYDHVLDRQFFGSEDLGNFAPICIPCHREKTAENAGKRGKADRRRKAFNGEKKCSRRKLEGRGFEPGYVPMPTGRVWGR